MHFISRRSFLKVSTILPFTLWISRLNAHGAMSPLVRPEVRTADGIAMLAKYAKAVAIMKDPGNTPVGNPISWQFQWFIHWTPRNKTTLLKEVYPQSTPAEWKDAAEKTWGTCQAHFQPSDREKFFLPWHRWYLAFFEGIIREVLHDESFALPYWDYASNPVLPEQFRMKNDLTFRPLFHENRGTGVDNHPVNDGDAIDEVVDIQKAMNDALCQTRYIKKDSQNPGFCDHLDFNLHGNIHGAIGGDMGTVPTAAQDPIFWLHHCNLDRLWASWLASGGRNPTDPTFLNEPFTFVDALGKSAIKTPGDVLDTADLGYSYDRLEQRSGDCPSFTQRESASVSVVTHQTPDSLLVGKHGGLIRLEPVLGSEREGARGQSWLVISGVTTNTAPGTIYEVFLNLRDPSNARERKARRVGQINFFDALPEEGHAGREDKVFSFRIGAIRTGSEPTITVLPRASVSSDVRVVVRHIEVIRR